MVIKKLFVNLFGSFLRKSLQNDKIENQKQNFNNKQKKDYNNKFGNANERAVQLKGALIFNPKVIDKNKDKVIDKSKVIYDNKVSVNNITKQNIQKDFSKNKQRKICSIFFVLGFVFGIFVLFSATKIIIRQMFVSYRHDNNLLFRSDYFLDDYDYYIRKAKKFGKEYGNGQLEMKLENGETLTSKLQKSGFNSDDVKQIISLLRNNINLKNLKTGQIFKIYYSFEIIPEPIMLNRTNVLYPVKHQNREHRNIDLFHFKTNNGSKYNISRKNDAFLLHAEQPKLITKRHIISGTITTSLFADVLVSDIKASTLYGALNEYAFLIDFQRDLHKGDKFVFILDTTRDTDGDVVDEKVFYVNLILSGKNYEMFNFNNRFYNRKGQSIKRALLKTPIDGARITSGFNPNRRHPIYGYSRAHLAIDLAAAQGTPIYSAGDGIVIEKVSSGGDCGKYVKIRHNAEYTTLYCHMSRFSNIKIGQFIRQRQVIGYVGMTGAATGPHLHYAVYRHGKAINPATIKTASTRNIESKYADEFEYTIKKIDKILKDHQ